MASYSKACDHSVAWVPQIFYQHIEEEERWDKASECRDSSAIYRHLLKPLCNALQCNKDKSRWILITLHTLMPFLPSFLMTKTFSRMVNLNSIWGVRNMPIVVGVSWCQPEEGSSWNLLALLPQYFLHNISSTIFLAHHYLHIFACTSVITSLLIIALAAVSQWSGKDQNDMERRHILIHTLHWLQCAGIFRCSCCWDFHIRGAPNIS